MRSLRNQLVVAVLGALMLGPIAGCGGTSDLEKPTTEAAKGPPDMSKMPGFDPASGKMKTEPTTPPKK